MPSSAAVGERTSASRSRAGSAASSTAYDEEEEATLRPPQVLARKLTCSVLTVVFMGGFLIILLQVGLTLTAVPDWSADAKQAMIDLEQENILKLASDKADYVDEIFGRVKEGLLQLQEFAGQALVAVPQTIVVDQYLMAYPGLEQSGTTWDHSSWFVSGFDIGEVPVADSALEGLLNRSSLMDVPFRGMQQQHLLVYLASLEDPSPAAGVVSGVNMQMYAAFDMEEAGYLDFGEGQVCDERATEYDENSSPTTYDPRCRPWYQDAVEAGLIFTNPYSDAGTGQLTITVAAPVYDGTDTTLMLGVVGMDVDLSDIENSIKDLNLIGDEGHAYLLAPGGGGEVAVHNDLQTLDGTQYITELESGVDAQEFGAIVTKMSEECAGFESYSRDGSIWLLAWKHETTTSSETGASDACSNGGFIAVVAVSEDVLLEAFSKLESEVPQIVALASVVMALIVMAIGCVTGCIARAVSVRITKPVNQLAEVVHALNRMDFSQQEAGTWLVNEISCPELEELIKAFESMATVVKFANMSLHDGDLELARQNYVNALILFKKLGNDRGVNIVNNNLGNVYTLQARELSANAAGERNKAKSTKLMKQANVLYNDAEASYRLAIDDARMMCATLKQRDEDDSTPLPKDSKREDHSPMTLPPDDIEAGSAPSPSGGVDECDLDADAAVFLQLANREFNLALCLAAKVSSSSNTARSCDNPKTAAATKEIRALIMDCVQVTADVKDAKSSQRQLEFLLELSSIELSQGRQRAAREAIDAAERVVVDYGAQMDREDDGDGSGGITTTPEGESPPMPIGVLRQQLLAARGALCIAEANPRAALQYWTNAVIGCGDRVSISAVRSSLEGLRELAAGGYNDDQFSSELLVALSLPLRGKKDPKSLTGAIDSALSRLQRLEASAGVRMAKVGRGKTSWKTNVDLCFVMDCTGSMQSWIDQAKEKLMEIIEQAKNDVANLNLRVAFVGYRDFGDKKRYEGPFDFCGEDELPGLLAKLRKIKAYGGDDVPEDVAGGLKHAAELSWKSPIRLCILIADAPCHGRMYHANIRDRFPAGCPSGLDPSKLMYTLQYDLGVDFYFVKVTRHTDTMISVFQSQLATLCQDTSRKKRRTRGARRKTEPKIVVHDLGSSDHRFLETVVASVKLSINLRVETY